MDDEKKILFNYLLSINDKSSGSINDSNNKNIISNNDNSILDIINNKEIVSSNNNNDISKNNEIDNRNEKKENLALNNQTSTEINKVELSFKDIDEKNFNIKNIFESNNYSKKEKEKDKDKDKDYNKVFKNRMDMMQAVLDDELNISSNNEHFIRRKIKSRTTIKNNIHQNKQVKSLKIENNEKENIKNENNINNDNEMNKINLNKYIKEKEKEITIKMKRKEDYKTDNIILYNENKHEEKHITQDIKNIKDIFPSKKNEIKPYINKISEEINLEIFNEKKANKRKGSYININFNNDKNNSKINSERMKIKEYSHYKPILIENNNFNKINKIKIHFNNSCITKKKDNKKSIDKGNSKNYCSQININIKNNINTINKVNNDNKKFPQSLDNLLSKINNTNEKKNKNINLREITNSNNNINQKIKDIKESLLKMNNIKKEENIKTDKLNINKKQIPFNNNIYFNLLDDSYKPMNKHFSRNNFLKKRFDSSDFISSNFADNSPFPSKGISKRTNSFSNIHTLNNTTNKYYYKNQNIFNINNININNLQFINKNPIIKNILEDFKHDNISKNIILSHIMKSISFINDKKFKTRLYLDNNTDNIIRLYYTSEKGINKTDSNVKLKGINNSNFKSYLNKINGKNLINDYSKLKSNSKKIKNEINTSFIKKKNIYQNKAITDKLILDQKKINNKKIPNTLIKINSKYIYNNNSYNKNMENKNKINNIQKYSQKSKDIYYNFKNMNIKNKIYPFERLRMKKNHFIFPVNLFD